jgi:predicted oxidoreductase
VRWRAHGGGRIRPGGVAAAATARYLNSQRVPALKTWGWVAGFADDGTVTYESICGTWNGPWRTSRRAASGNPPGAQEPGSFDRVDALEAARRDCLGLAPVS